MPAIDERAAQTKANFKQDFTVLGCLARRLASPCRLKRAARTSSRSTRLTFAVFNTMLGSPQEGGSNAHQMPRMILVSEAVLAVAPSHAQTYDPNFPVCLQV
jgi:hypothetical protein